MKRIIPPETIEKLRQIAGNKRLSEIQRIFPTYSNSTLHNLMRRNNISYLRQEATSERSMRRKQRDAAKEFFSFDDYRIGSSDYKMV
jgi:hypothetical protein